MHQPTALDPLLNQLRRANEAGFLAVAAAEALAKVGPPALPALIELTRTGMSMQRLYAYARPGWIPTMTPIRDSQKGFSRTALCGIASRQHWLTTVKARQYSSFTRPNQICEFRQRAEFEEALRTLHCQQCTVPLYRADWRLRYRLLPTWGGSFDLGWLGIASVLHKDESFLTGPAGTAGWSLEEIVQESPESERIPERCENCGERIEYPTGLPACPETALPATVYQLRLLTESRERGVENLFDLLDALRDHQWSALEQERPQSRSKQRRDQQHADEQQAFYQTCRWFIEQGIEHVGPAKARLLAEAARMATEYGDPDNLLGLRQPVDTQASKIGRNDPCPCGTG